VLIKLIREYLFKYRKWLVLVLVFQTIQSLATLTLPTLNADIIDNIVSKGPNSYIWKVGAVMLGVTFIQVTFAIAATFYGARSAMGFGAMSGATSSTPSWATRPARSANSAHPR